MRKPFEVTDSPRHGRGRSGGPNRLRLQANAQGRATLPHRATGVGASAAANRPIPHGGAAFRHAVARGPVAVEDLHRRNRQVGNPRHPRARAVKPAAAFRRADLTARRLPEHPVCAAAAAVPAAVPDAGRQIRRVEPIRVLSYLAGAASPGSAPTSTPSGDSARIASSLMRPRSSAVLNSTAISCAVRRPCGRSQR
jgi:hypothetical protein